MRIRILLFGLVYLVAALGTCLADSMSLSGYLNDSANTHLVGSNLGAAQFGPSEIANNVALYTINIAVTGLTTFTSSGFAVGGTDPYFTLFSGSGNSATFLGSNYAQAISTGGDFSLGFNLLAGDYTIALGTYSNMSLAENGGGTLGDGFVALGGDYYLGSSYYQLDVSSTPAVPEPATLTLLATGLAGVLGLRRRRQT